MRKPLFSALMMSSNNEGAQPKHIVNSMTKRMSTDGPYRVDQLLMVRLL